MSDFFPNSSGQRTAEYNRYFRLMSEGLTTRDVFDFREEMWALSEYAVDPALRRKAAQEIDRFGDIVAPVAASCQ